jgi:hypothetical protein
MKRSGYVDFAALKQRVSILQVIEMLHLMLRKQKGIECLDVVPSTKEALTASLSSRPQKDCGFVMGDATRAVI